MPALDKIVALLHRHRKDLEEFVENTSSLTSETAQIVEKLHELRRRSELTQQKFASSGESRQNNSD